MKGFGFHLNWNALTIVWYRSIAIVVNVMELTINAAISINGINLHINSPKCCKREKIILFE